jgi:phosphoenolpyruvate carboxylase
MELQKLKKAKNPDQKQMEVMETMITRSLFGNINASRNSA